MSLAYGIGSLSRRKPFLLSSPGEQHVFSHQSRFLLPSNEHSFTQRKRHRQPPLLPTPIHQPFAQQWRTFLPPFHVIQPFIQHNKNRIHLWRNRINNYPSPHYSWRHPSMKRNTGSQFAKRKCLLSPFKKQFTGNPSPISHKIVPIDFVRGCDKESDIIQDEMDTYSQSDKLVKLGEWEKHTKGIGAKLLLKMGFQPGKGLGKSLQGRTQPVEAMAPNGGVGGAIGSDKQVLLSPAQQSAEYSCQASNDLRSPSSYLIAATSTPEVICISSSDEDDYLILHPANLPEAPSPVCHTSFEANVMQTREKRLSELPWTYETLCSTSSRIPTIANSPFAVKPAYSVTATETPDIVYISSSDEGECVVLYDNSPRQR